MSNGKKSLQPLDVLDPFIKGELLQQDALSQDAPLGPRDDAVAHLRVNRQEQGAVLPIVFLEAFLRFVAINWAFPCC